MLTVSGSRLTPHVGVSPKPRTGQECSHTRSIVVSLVFRDRSHDALLPWDIIDGGMKASFYRSEFDKSLREEWTLPPKRQKENARLLPVLP